VTIINANGPGLTLAKTDASCGSSNGSITVTGSGGTSPYQYSKDGTSYQLSNQFTGLAAGNYIITIKDATGCTNSSNIVVGISVRPFYRANLLLPVVVIAMVVLPPMFQVVQHPMYILLMQSIFKPAMLLQGWHPARIPSR
jgi:hypothetical protein